MTLPRLSFEMTSIAYDGTRKAGVTQTFKATDGENMKKVFMPVPYNIGFQLSVIAKLNDDALQIVEQILPFFQPSFNLTVDLIDSIGEKRDIPVVLDNVSFQDDYEGDFTTGRVLTYTLRFTVKTYLFGPVSSSTDNIIKKSTISYIAGDTPTSMSRGIVYSVEPRAIKNYTGTIITNLTNDISTTDTMITVNNASGISVNTYLDLEGEEVYVTAKSGNVITGVS